jgi:hypothetical protein
MSCKSESLTFHPPRLNLLGNSSMGMHPVPVAWQCALPFWAASHPPSFFSFDLYCRKHRLWLMPHKFGGSKLDFVIAPLPLASNYDASSMAGSSCSECQAMSQVDPGPYYDSYATDLALGKYSLSWDSLSSMDIWLEQEQQCKFIELRLKERERNKISDRWTEKLIHVCASWYSVILQTCLVWSYGYINIFFYDI